MKRSWKRLKRHENLIAEELNVKEVEFHSDETAFVSLIAKPNFRVLGKKVGKLMNAVQKAVEKLPSKDQKQLLNGQEVTIKVEGETIVLTPEDVTVERQVKAECHCRNRARYYCGFRHGP